MRIVKTSVSSMFMSGPVPATAPDVSHGDPVARIDEVAGRYQGVDIPGLAELLVKTHGGLATY